MNLLLIQLKALLENKSIPLVIFESLEFNEGLKDWAINELKLAGLYDKDSDYGGMIGKAIEEIIEIFSKQGHSGGSAAIVIGILEKLLRYEPLTPCDHSDYIDHTEISGGKPMFQCIRCYNMFSEDNGKTWYSVKDKTENLKELSYPGAIWFEEIFRFYKLATEEEIRNFEKLVKADNESEAFKLVKRVLEL